MSEEEKNIPSPLMGEGEGGGEDSRYYFPCPLRKGQSRIAVTVCHKERCLYLESEDGKLRCGGLKPIVRNRCGGFKLK